MKFNLLSTRTTRRGSAVIMMLALIAMLLVIVSANNGSINSLRRELRVIERAQQRHWQACEAKSENRNPKSETNPKSEARNPESGPGGSRLAGAKLESESREFGVRASDFGFVSDFGFRTSGFYFAHD